ncbi:hypothetical protein DdX_20481 [Ditylenchus destructor]|uniref:Uncharacterized protein n=1 Tax=Ditylenchus destructor TaxID=166010 RepID=A0AAD4QTL2_9BILA|nr:hypothetical protein DdX_20481 [Ditylenchus destructor]
MLRIFATWLHRCRPRRNLPNLDFGGDGDDDNSDSIYTELDDDENEYNGDLAGAIELEREVQKSKNEEHKRFVDPVSVVVISHTVYVGTLPVQACLPVIVLYWMIVGIYGLVFGSFFVLEVVAIGFAIKEGFSSSKKKKKHKKASIGDNFYAGDGYPVTSPSYDDPYKYGHDPW